MSSVRIGNKEFRKRKILAIFLLIFLILYFLYNILGGDRGIISMFELNKKHHELDSELKTLYSEKEALESKINRLKGDSLDLDLLEEQVKENLGYAKKNETLYVEEQEK